MKKIAEFLDPVPLHKDDCQIYVFYHDTRRFVYCHERERSRGIFANKNSKIIKEGLQTSISLAIMNDISDQLGLLKK